MDKCSVEPADPADGHDRSEACKKLRSACIGAIRYAPHFSRHLISLGYVEGSLARPW